MTFEKVMKRLSRCRIVAGWITIGSASKNELTPASDYDLVVVLSEMPDTLAPCGVTYIDQRLTDLIFVTTAQIDQILALDEPVDGEDWLGRIVRWLEVGVVGFDRSGRLHRAQQKVQTGEWLEAMDEDAYSPWFRINYNLVQSKRLLASDDPVYLMAADMRLALYGAPDLLFNYFVIRNLRWEGEKAAVRYLMAHDPFYLDLFRQFVAESNRECKFQLYEQLATLTVAPMGELWHDGTTVLGLLNPKEMSPDAMEDTLNFWERLMAEPM